jgi:hypothetical protein
MPGLFLRFLCHRSSRPPQRRRESNLPRPAKSNEKACSPLSIRPTPHEIKILIDDEDGDQNLFVLLGTPEGDAVHYGFGTCVACHGVAN